MLKQLYDERGKPIENNTDRTKMYADLNHDGLIDQRDYYRYKSPAPKAILGFSSNMSYKNLSLAFTVRSNIGGYVYNNILGDRSAFTSLYPSQPFLLNGNPRLYATQFHQPQLNSDFYVQDASFVRLENITVGYNLSGLVKRIWTRTPRQPVLRLTAAVQNTLVLTKYTGVNPELFYGVDNLVYPLPRTFTLGLNAGF